MYGVERDNCNDWQGGMESPDAGFFVGEEQKKWEKKHDSENGLLVYFMD